MLSEDGGQCRLPRVLNLIHVGYPHGHAPGHFQKQAPDISNSVSENVGSHLVLCAVTFLGIYNAADRPIVQLHGSPDLGQTVAVFQVGTANGVIASCAVGSGTGGEQLAQLRSGRKPLLTPYLLPLVHITP